MTDHLAILIVVLPLLAAPTIVLLGNRGLAFAIAVAVTWASLGMTIGLSIEVHRSGPVHYEIGGWTPPYGIEYVVDALSSYVMLIVTGMAAIVLAYAPRSVRREIPPEQHALFYATFLLCMTGLLGICITGDLFNVFVFLEISSLSSYALISLGPTRRAPLAALQYLIIGTIGATFMLIGIGLVYQMTGTLNMYDIAGRLPIAEGPRTVLVAFAFLTVGLGIKMAVFPLHTWLPGAYADAPSVVTAFIAATSTKVSVYAFLRVVYRIFSPEFAFGDMLLGEALLLLALIGIFAASAAAIFQDDVKRLLAFSSVAQIGYMLLGISLADRAGLTGGIVHMFNHALIKGGLFMVVGCLAYRLGSTRIDDMRGVARTMPWTATAFAVGGLALIGVPLTAGFISKWLLLTSSIEGGRFATAALMLISSLLAVAYVWKVVEVMFFGQPSARVSRLREAPAAMLAPTYAVIFLTLMFGVWTTYSVGPAQSAADLLLSAVPQALEITP